MLDRTKNKPKDEEETTYEILRESNEKKRYMKKAQAQATHTHRASRSTVYIESTTSYTFLAPNNCKLTAVSLPPALPELSAKISHLGCTKGYVLTSLCMCNCNFPGACIPICA
jgi:hypothetical protein